MLAARGHVRWTEDRTICTGRIFKGRLSLPVAVCHTFEEQQSEEEPETLQGTCLEEDNGLNIEEVPVCMTKHVVCSESSYLGACLGKQGCSHAASCTRAYHDCITDYLQGTVLETPHLHMRAPGV